MEVGWGGVGYERSCTMRTDVDATLLLRHCSGVGWWGGILTFMYHAYRRGCYAAATSLFRGWVVGWDINVHVPCVQTWMLRCCYVTVQGLGGGVGYERSCTMRTDVDATLLLRHCSGVGWWGGILTFMYHAYRRGCYAAATSLFRGWVVGWDINVHVPCVQTWMLRCCYVTVQGLGGGVGY